MNDDISEANLDLQTMRASLGEVNRAFRELEQIMQKPMDALGDASLQNAARLNRMNAEISQVKDSLERDFGKALTGAIRNGDGFLSFFEKMRASLEELVLQLAVVNPLLNFAFGGERGDVSGLGAAAGIYGRNPGNGLLGDIVGGIAGLFEARAFGGPVAAGRPYLVGERGPEVFVPQAAGRIQQQPGAQPVSIIMNISTPDAAGFRASQTQIAASMMDAARRAQRIR